jgi:sterol desaturase/sphingolipid hydroxylase (fatty acid hydroxylase superfamily)
MSSFVSKNLLWLAVAQSLATWLVAYLQGWNLEIAVLISTLLTLAVALVAERFVPYRNDWNQSHADTKTDLTSAVILVAVIDPILKLLAPLAVITVYGLINWNLPTMLSEQPLVFQIILVTLLIEFGRYWSHRLHHSIAPFWWLHAMHHSSQRLYAINNMRYNPLNYAINFLIGALPAMLLAPSTEALFGYLALTQPVLMLQHANIDLKSGWLNYLFSTNELHRWHHSTESDKANSNYGNAIVLWDQIFGTFRIQSAQDQTQQSVGLFESSNNYPSASSYWSQLGSIRRLVVLSKELEKGS